MAGTIGRSPSPGRQPVRWSGRTIGRSVWGRAWCRHLEQYGDFVNRLPRGRTYLRRGSVLHLQIGPGEVKALVVGTRLYEQSIQIRPLRSDEVRRLVELCAANVADVADLVRGRLPESILAALRDPRTGLFPDPGEIELSCSCPDWAVLCKHLAAALYGVGVRLDAQPELLFVLRGVSPDDLVRGASSSFATPSPLEDRPRLDPSKLSELFDIEFVDPPPGPGPSSVPDRALAGQPSMPDEEPSEALVFRRADLLALGLRPSQIERWLRLDVLLRTERRGHYELTEEAWETIEPLLDGEE